MLTETCARVWVGVGAGTVRQPEEAVAKWGEPSTFDELAQVRFSRDHRAWRRPY